MTVIMQPGFRNNVLVNDSGHEAKLGKRQRVTNGHGTSRMCSLWDEHDLIGLSTELYKMKKNKVGLYWIFFMCRERIMYTFQTLSLTSETSNKHKMTLKCNKIKYIIYSGPL